MMQPKERLSAKELAAVIGVSERTITNWKNKGWLPPRKRFGGRFVWDVQEVRQYLENLGIEQKPC
jgi:predicted DNA-binding transcriptional regulator AlpA